MRSSSAPIDWRLQTSATVSVFLSASIFSAFSASRSPFLRVFRRVDVFDLLPFSSPGWFPLSVRQFLLRLAHGGVCFGLIWLFTTWLAIFFLAFRSRTIADCSFPAFFGSSSEGRLCECVCVFSYQQHRHCCRAFSWCHRQFYFPNFRAFQFRIWFQKLLFHFFHWCFNGAAGFSTTSASALRLFFRFFLLRFFLCFLIWSSSGASESDLLFKNFGPHLSFQLPVLLFQVQQTSRPFIRFIGSAASAASPLAAMNPLLHHFILINLIFLFLV